MKFGVCGDIKTAGVAAAAGYDYAEWSVGAVLKPREDEAAFEAALSEVRAAELRYPVLNIFIPGDLKITGPDADLVALETYVATTMRRAETAGVECIVFGSGGARRIPDGFDTAAAHDQLVAFGRMAGPIAADHGVTIVVEPLNLAECNVLNTVAESAAYVKEVSHPGFLLLVDAYHMMRDDDPFDDIVAYGELIKHAHIATVPNRLSPGGEQCDFTGFFAALAKAGYTGRLSIEARIADVETELPVALAEMKRLAES
ncbi:MAG: sugar phosphate isomerase/epimerase [Spirochaetaceae bacterium]|nr:MAG: sugar phosphate isomerase/epimerase [Spirochaetaceae bacterium]